MGAMPSTNDHEQSQSRSKSSFGIVVLFGFLAFGGLASWLFGANRAPIDLSSALVVPEEVDLGMVPMGLPVKFEVPVSNTSDSTIRIQDIDTSCGCTVLQEAPLSIAPGKSARIHGVTNTQRLAGEQLTSIKFNYNREFHQKSRIVATTVGPVERIELDQVNSEWVFQLRESFREVLVGVKCFVSDHDLELPCSFDAANMIMRMPQAIQGELRLDFVYQIQVDEHDPFEIMEEVMLNPS